MKELSSTLIFLQSHSLQILETNGSQQFHIHVRYVFYILRIDMLFCSIKLLFCNCCESCRSNIAPTRCCQAPYIVGLPLPSLTRFKAVRPIEVKADNIRRGYGAILTWWPMQVAMGVCVVNPVDPTSLPHGAAKRLLLWGSLYLV